jgi:hypothetical protein
VVTDFGAANSHGNTLATEPVTVYGQFARILIDVVYGYALIGVIFASAFVAVGVSHLDPDSRGSGAGFRLLIFPGSVAFWPILLRRWLTGLTEPPQEGNPHR